VCEEDQNNIRIFKELTAYTVTLPGLLSDECTVNPDFCGCSMIYVRYCDGASYSGNMQVRVNNEIENG